MAQTIQLRRSATQGTVPTTAQLQLGELAINTYDGKVYIKKDDGSESIVQVNPLTTSDLPEGINLYYTDSRARLAVGAVTKDMTGFLDRTNSTLSFVAGTRTLTLTPTTTATVYYRGKAISISSAKSIVITNTSGGRYIKLDPDTETLVENGIGANPSIKDDLLVAYVYWDAANSKAIIFGDERHGSDRDTQWHLSQHLDVGAVWRSGGSATYTLNSQTSIGFGLGTPIVIADEDVVHTINHSASPSSPYEQILDTAASLPVLYLSGTNYLQSTPSTNPWLVGASTAQYNLITGGSGSLVQADNNKYITYWVVATNDSVYPIKMIVGHLQHNQIVDAEAETFDNYGLPMPEVAPMYKIIIQTASGYTNKVIIVSVNTLQGRQSSLSSSFSATSHNALSERSLSNQHPISAITDLQSTLDAKVSTSGLLTAITAIDGASSGIDADLLDGQQGSYYTNYDNLSNTPTSLSDFTNDMWEVTTTAPTDGTGKPVGYVWYVI